jgi:hypothetical protein|tara:strand:+ start:1014 stop:1601 length:588 start_codon:yes stop_codon:yes gene_type:complete
MAGIPKELQEVLFERSIPGQSLTNPIEQRYPWEQPPQMTSVKEAREKIFLNLLEPNKLRSVIELMSTKIPVNTIAQVVLREGFNKGKFNPDMMLNLLEPTMYMLMAIAEKAGIEPVIDADDDDDTDEIEAVDLEEQSKNMIGEGGRFQDAKVRNIQPMSVGRDIKEQLENLDGAKLRASLLEKREPKERTSLLEK